jgi:single-strand DNA-binding protein
MLMKQNKSSTEIKTFLKQVCRITAGTKRKVMNALKNKVQLIGNLGNAPEVKNTEKGKKLAKFSIATNETYYNVKGEKVTETQWHNLIAWGKVAELVEKYLTKGSEVAIEGKLMNNNYMDKDGNKRYSTEVQVHELLLLGSKPSA